MMFYSVEELVLICTETVLPRSLFGSTDSNQHGSSINYSEAASANTTTTHCLERKRESSWADRLQKQ